MLVCPATRSRPRRVFLENHVVGVPKHRVYGQNDGEDEIPWDKGQKGCVYQDTALQSLSDICISSNSMPGPTALIGRACKCHLSVGHTDCVLLTSGADKHLLEVAVDSGFPSLHHEITHPSRHCAHLLVSFEGRKSRDPGGDGAQSCLF